MALFGFSQTDTFAKAAALVTIVLLIWATARFRWFSERADETDERRLGALMVAVSVVAVAVVIAAALLGPHPA